MLGPLLASGDARTVRTHLWWNALSWYWLTFSTSSAPKLMGAISTSVASLQSPLLLSLAWSLSVQTRLYSCSAFSAPVRVIVRRAVICKLQLIQPSLLCIVCVLSEELSVVFVLHLHSNTINPLDSCCLPLCKQACIQVKQDRG